MIAKKHLYEALAIEGAKPKEMLRRQTAGMTGGKKAEPHGKATDQPDPPIIGRPKIHVVHIFTGRRD